MKKMVVLVVVAVVVILVAVGVFYLISNLDSLVAGAIEKHGGEATGTSVRVAGVSISLREGRGTIDGLRVANPEGFASRDAFTLGSIVIDIDVKSLREEPIVVDEIRVEAPVVFAEITATGTSNIDALRRNAQAYAEPAGGGEAEAGGEAKRFRIKRFVFEKGRIEVDASALGIEARSIDLPAIRLDDIGGERGALPGEIAAIVMKAVAGRALSAIGSAGIEGTIREKLEGATPEEAKKLLERIGG